MPATALKVHVAIHVSDVLRSTEFYQKLFGISPVKVRRSYAKFDVSNPPVNFTLNEVPFNGRGALSHLGIQVGSTEDVLAVRRQWEESGLVPRDEMQTTCCYALQDKAWVSDPDGNEWEVFVVLKDQFAENVAGGECCATASDNEPKAPAAAVNASCCAPGNPCCSPN